MFVRLVSAVAIAALLPAAAIAQGESLAGIYDGGQVEVAAGLELNDDGRFEYALSYGALDETASGSWSIEDGSLVLTGDPVTAPAFVLVGTKPGRGRKLAVTLDVPPYLPVQLFSAFVATNGGGVRAEFETSTVKVAVDKADPRAELVVALPIFELVSPRFALPAGTRSARVRFDANDLGRVAFDREVLPREGDSFVLERYGRRLKFRRVEFEGVPPEE